VLQEIWLLKRIKILIKKQESQLQAASYRFQAKNIGQACCLKLAAHGQPNNAQPQQ
jgi:hypothetical protein